MTGKPKAGMQCWIVGDVWETLFPIPVTITEADESTGTYCARWQITEEYTEDYEGLRKSDFYATECEAREQIKLERRNEDAGKGNGVLGG